MKKILLVASLALLLAAPRVLADEKAHADLEDQNENETEDCVNFHAGNEKEELHESAEAELHEKEDEVCASGTPTATPTLTPSSTPTGTGTPTSTPTGTPTGTSVATGTPTSSPAASPSPSASPLAIIPQGTGLTDQLTAIITKLIDLLKQLGERD